ncbi:MAG: LuxR family transcriptional regulator [Chloroflexi bacterium]|nr:LuxR family transcriptional regulator [Chloroflexota bacterium]
MIDEFPDGVWLIELAPISDPALVEQTVASVLGVREKPDRLLSNLLVEDLRNKHLLLILDNCEHLVEACVRLIIDLLRACPKLFTIASSREALGIRGEIVYNVPTLSLPDLPGDPDQLTAMMRNESCQLFIERAMAVQAHFQLNLDHAKAIIQICRRLDGIPLAIEMAAARMKMLSAEQIAARLDARFRLLTDGERTAHARQKTLRALIDWSYDLLLVPERALLGRLSVFAGGWSLEAAEEVCTGAMPVSSPDHSASGGDEPLDVFELLGQLVSKSMVVIDFDPAGETRYRFLETIRQYAREKLLQTNELEFYLERHFQYFYKLTKLAELFLESTDQVLWMDRIERDYDDIRSALRWSIDHKRVVEGLQLTQALKIFWYTRGYFSEGREWLGELLGLANEPTLERVLALDQAGFLARYQCDFEAAAGFIGEALTIWRRLGNSKGQADSLANLGYVILFQGDLERAYTLYEESLQINRRLNNQQGLADALSHLGMIAFYRGDFEQAYQLHTESLSIWRKLGDRTGISHALNRLASVAFEAGRSEETYQLALESLNLAWDLKYREGIAWVLELFAIYSAQAGRWKQAVRLEAIYTKYRQVVGLPQSPAQRRLLSNRLAPVHAALSKSEFEQARASGDNTPVEQLVLKILAGKHINEINSDN